MRVFVLGTGRCGTTTFAHAAQHFTNFSAGHETRAFSQLFDARFDFPDDHIEADNRLAWFTGDLAKRFDGTDVFYVHLVRDREATAQSYLKRWGYQGGIMKAFAHGILARNNAWDEDRRPDVARFMVDTINNNVTEFLRTRPHMVMHLESARADFQQFVDLVDARGDLDASLAEWGRHHNASR